jgi:hypothetical protein
MNEPLIFRFRCPSKLRIALKAKAADEMISVSACVRRLLFRSLAADGTVVRRPELVDPVRDREAAA